jgi:steroid delta-isomerase-like uncharacterized protein
VPTARDVGADEMERLAFRYCDAKNALDATAALAVCTEDFVFEVATGRPVRVAGSANVRLHLIELWTAIPDLHTKVEWIATAPRRLVAGGTLTGTQRGAYFGVPPTGRRFEVPLVSVLSFAEGRISAESNHVDLLALLSQIGALGAPAVAAPAR